MCAKPRKKKRWIPVAAVVMAAALGAGIWFGTRGSGEPVSVYPFQYIGMPEFWGDAQESYGPVTTDKIQTEFLSDTQTVTEVKVQNGDSVKKGDILFSFDTTLDALSLERKRLDVEKIKVQIKAAEERLQDTRKLIPYTPPGQMDPEEEEADLGKELTEPYQISERVGQDKQSYDGKSKETALICWLKDTTAISDDILQKLFETAVDYQKAAPQQPETGEALEKSSASDVPEESEDDRNAGNQMEEAPEQTYEVPGFFTCNGETVKPDRMQVGAEGYLIRDTYRYQDKTYWLKSAVRKKDGAVLKDLTIDAYPQVRDEQIAWEELWGDGVEVQYTRSVTFAGKILQNGEWTSFPEDLPVKLQVDRTAVLMISSEIDHLNKETQVSYRVTPEDGMFQTSTDGNRLFLTATPSKAAAEPAEYTITARYEFQDNKDGIWWRVDEPYSFSVTVDSQASRGEFYVVFKTTEKNMEKGAATVWHGARITAFEDGSFHLTPYNASGFADHTLPLPEEIEIDLPEIDPNAMYTAEEILEMQKQCYATIKEQNEKLKLAESEYNIMERELGDGNIYAEIDGKVVSLLTEEEARQQKQPVIKVSGGGGFFIEGSVSELEKEKLKVGQEVTVNDWSSGGMYTGEVVSIGDFPSDSDNWNGMGNPTASYYPFKAFVSEEADLQAGSYVSMSYSTASAEQGIYLDKAFVRTEKGDSFIFVRGADGKLEKRNVKLGKVLWGSYYEILSPLSEDDLLAFPYGKHVKAGAPTVESDISTLYSY